MTTHYPSIPIPVAQLQSMFEVMLLMRQVINLLTVNAQSPSQPTLTQAAQIFATQDHLASQVVQVVEISSAQVAELQSQIDTLNATTTSQQLQIDNLQSQIDTINATLADALLDTDSQLEITVPVEAANDAAANTAGVPIGGIYKTGSALKVRVA